MATGHRRKRVERDSWSQRLGRRFVGVVGSGTVVLASAGALMVQPVATAVPDYDLITAAQPQADEMRISRDTERAPIASPAEAKSQVEGVMYTTAEVKILAHPSDDAAVLTELDSEEKVRVTGVEDGEWTQIMHKDRPRWVPTAELTKEKPEPEPEEPVAPVLSYAPCVQGSGVESGLQADAVRVYRAVCARFPQVSRYGGRAPRGEHSGGRALDIMVSGPLGWEIANFLHENRYRLGVQNIIYEQRIWTAQRAGEGWRAMSNRGSATANHYDHVHVLTYGAAGTG